MNEDKIRNLEMIQNIISRMATNSFLLKGWCVTVIAGIFSMNYENNSMAMYILTYCVIILFWLMDAYYLQLERKYRIVYNDTLKNDKATFKLDVPKTDFEQRTTFFQTMISKTEIFFYFSIAILISIVFYNI